MGVPSSRLICSLWAPQKSSIVVFYPRRVNVPWIPNAGPERLTPWAAIRWPAIIRGLKIGASVAACGVAGGAALNTTVFPFILRGVNLLGINSVILTSEERLEIWRRLSVDLPLPLLDSMTQEEPLDRIFELGEKILKGAIRGRTVIRIS